MLGYYKNEAETAKVIKNGWLHTGDMGAVDDEGYVYITGRKKNIIISNGINIYPEEIEEILSGHNFVHGVCVYGEKHDILGEVPVAKVVLHDKKNVCEKELVNYCRDYLSDYKIPTKIYFVDSLPSTSSGKIKRMEIKK